MIFEVLFHWTKEFTFIVPEAEIKSGQLFVHI